MAKHTVEVTSVKEYKEAVEAAETLGLEVKKITGSRYGWETPDADAIHPSGKLEIDKIGRKYVHFDFGSEGVARAAFGYDSINDEPAYLRLYFN